MTFLLAILVVVLVILTLSWIIHISQVNDFTRINGWAGYKKFKKEFEKVDWIFDGVFKYSLFEKNTFDTSEIHAGIIKFNSIGMKIHNPLSYLLVKIYLYKYTRKHRSYEKFKW